MFVYFTKNVANHNLLIESYRNEHFKVYCTINKKGKEKKEEVYMTLEKECYTPERKDVLKEDLSSDFVTLTFILNYIKGSNLTYSPLETLAILSKTNKYFLKTVPILDLNTTPNPLSEEPIDLYKPVVLGSEYKSGCQVIAGQDKVLKLKELGERYVQAYVPHFEPKILYHVSPDLDIIETFTPRIPHEVMQGEDSFEERICVSDSLEGCFSSAPWGGSLLEDTMYDEETEETSKEFRVYEFNTSNILSGHIMTPKELHIRDYVLDALFKGEHWILSEEPYIRTYTIKVTDWEESAQDLLSHSDYEALDDGMDYDEVWSGEVTTVVYHLTYEIVGN